MPRALAALMYSIPNTSNIAVRVVRAIKPTDGRPNVIIGSTIPRQPAANPRLGNHPKCKLNKSISKTAKKNSGIDDVKSESVITTLSTNLFCLRAAIIPKTTPNTDATIIPPNANIKVYGRASINTSTIVRLRK